MTSLEQVRARAAEVGLDEAICGGCGLYEPGEGDMGTCRRSREDQFRMGVCLHWTTSTIAPPRTQSSVAADGSKKLFSGAEEPPQDDSPAGEVHGLKCAEPGCKRLLVLRRSHRLSMWFYGCQGYPSCNGTLPAEDDGSPRGRPRTRELQGWRNRAHEAFDCLWKDGHCDRGAAYSWLRAATGLSHKNAHMMKMNVEQCQTVIRLVTDKGPGTEFWDQWRTARAQRKKGQARCLEKQK
jgi:ssDNA-binding Zn-finger/Zn-ribbon topoisomerase 1